MLFVGVDGEDDNDDEDHHHHQDHHHYQRKRHIYCLILKMTAAKPT